MGKKPKGFHQPFAALAERTKELVPAPKPKPPAPPAPAPVPPLDEERLFADEMAGVAPLDPDPRGRLNAPAPTPRPPVSRRVREEAEAYAQLAELVGGEGAFDISDSDEYIEGLAPGVDRRLLKKLRRGDFALQGHLDLHGLTADEARGEVERFLDGACAAGKRCLLIIHGRGLNSKEGVPILKERLKVWLSRGRLSRAVLAFSTARPADGGAGAIYVLLRR